MMVTDYLPRNCVAQDLLVFFFKMLIGVCDNVYVYC